MSKLEVDTIDTKTGTNSLTIKQNDTAAITIDTSQNVGIGTSSPLAQLHIQGSDITDQIIIENTNSGAETAPDLTLYRNSSSPADSDTLGNIIFRGRNDNSEDINYFEITAVAKDVSDGTEDTQVEFATKAGGSNSTIMTFVSDNIGIGESTPDTKLHVKAGSSGTETAFTDSVITLENSGNCRLQFLSGNTNQGEILFGDGNLNRQGRITYDHSDDSLALQTTNAERMRIQSNGRALFSTTGNNSVLHSSWKYQMRFDGGSDAGLFMASEANANGTGFIEFTRSSTTGIGSITRNGTADQVNFNTSSDYRMKENVIDLSDATTRVKQLQPKRFSWISQESDTATQDGFIAHEVQSIVPEAVTGEHNEVEVWKEGEELPEGVSVGDNKLDDKGNTIPKYQGIDQSKLVPLLTASLKEAIAKIEELETRIATLENA